jgi:hypothetical protein
MKGQNKQGEPGIQYSGQQINIGNIAFNVEYRIKEAVLINDRVIVLYDPDAAPSPYGQFNNLVAYDLNGNKLWIAEHPTNDSGDHYTAISTSLPLTVHNWEGFECAIDPISGKVAQKIFIK